MTSVGSNIENQLVTFLVFLLLKYRQFYGRKANEAGHVARMEECRYAFKILTGKLTGKRPLGRPRHRWEDNTRMDLKEIGINAGNWVDSTQDREYFKIRKRLPQH